MFVKPVCSLVPVIPGAGWRVGATVRHAYGCVRRVGVHTSLSLALGLACSLALLLSSTPHAARRARAVAALAFRVIAIPVACPVSRGARARARTGARAPRRAGRARDSAVWLAGGSNMLNCPRGQMRTKPAKVGHLATGAI